LTTVHRSIRRRPRAGCRPCPMPRHGRASTRSVFAKCSAWGRRAWKRFGVEPGGERRDCSAKMRNDCKRSFRICSRKLETSLITMQGRECYMKQR
jgi:hypothetical protein